MLSVVATLLVFFAAHAYAATLAAMGHYHLSFSNALKRGIAESLGMIVVGIFPVVVLLFGVIGLIRPVDAVWLALLLDMLLLGLLGWIVTATRLKNVWARVGGALVSAGFGALIIVLKALIH